MNALLLLVLLASPPVQISHYDVHGMTPAQIRESINESRPTGQDGKRWDAIAKWYVTWKYKTAQSSAGCSVQSFDVNLETSMTLPRLTNEAPAAVKEKWREYLAALTAHEKGHLQFGNSAAKAIQQAGTTMPARGTCEELRRDIRTMAHQILDDHRRREVEYDEQTGHGRTQGVRFP